MYALSPGRGSFCRPAFSGSPCPPLAAARVGGRARSRAPGRSPGACPSAPGGRRSVSAQGVPAAGCARPCARSAAPPSPRPSPRSARGSGALWGVLAPLRLGLALASGGGAGSPLPRPLRGFVRSRSPGGASGRGCAAPLCALVRPPGVWGGAAAAAAAALLRRSVSLRSRAWGFSGAAAPLLFIRRAYLLSIRRVLKLSAQDNFRGS